MQMRVVVHARQRGFHGAFHAHLVDVAHVKHLHAGLPHELLFAFVHAANADLPHHRRGDRRKRTANACQLARAMAAQRGNRHAVNIAGGRQRVGIEVGMGVKPQHPQLFAHLAAMPGDRTDRANAQAMVATHQDGQVAGIQALEHRLMHSAVPGGYFGQVAVTVNRRQPRVGRAADVAGVVHLQAMALQGFNDAGNPQCLWPHRRAAAARSHVGRCANQVNGGAIRVFHGNLDLVS